MLGSNDKGCDNQHPSGCRNTYIKISTSLGSVPAADGGLVPSQTYNDLVAGADNTAVLTVIVADPERLSIMTGS